ncbi:MAG: hypothetical protein WCJ29_05535 [bacterium]
MGKRLIVNLGSTSRKYALFDDSGEVTRVSLSKDESVVLKLGKNLQSPDEIEAVVLRIVAPGLYFLKHREIDSEFVHKMNRAAVFSPLHLKSTLREYHELRKIFRSARFFGISDSAFQSTKPEAAFHYGLPREMAHKHELYRYGYHGISCSAVVRQIVEVEERLPQNLIICHLGGGASITAVREGKAIDNSMGFSPLEGLIMETRAGNTDPMALAMLSKSYGLNQEKLLEVLNKKSGLLGLHGHECDMLKLLALEARGEKAAREALDVYIYRIVKEIGGMITALGGLNAIAFTGAIGAGSSLIRARVIEGLKVFEIGLDAKKNRTAKGFARVDTLLSRVAVFAVPSDEFGEMNLIAKKLYSNKKPKEKSGLGILQRFLW